VNERVFEKWQSFSWFYYYYATRDGVAAVATVSDMVLAAVQFGVNTGFLFGKTIAAGATTTAIAGAATVVALGASGNVSQTAVMCAVGAAAAMKVVEVGVHVAHATTAGGLSLGRLVTAQTLGVADQIFEAYGIPNGVRRREWEARVKVLNNYRPDGNGTTVGASFPRATTLRL